PVPQEHRDLAVDLQEKDPNSMLWFTRQMLQWRKQQSAILEGDMQLVETNSPEVFAFIRQSSDEDPQKIFFAFNYSPNPTSIETTMDVSQQGQQLVSNDFFSRVTEDSGKISIPPYGVFIAAIK
nr:alpha-glucosidase C-terminal domain-containing protein [Gammaproteobacteria bacterium]